MKKPKKSSAKASSVKLSPAQKAANTRKSKQIELAKELFDLKSKNLQLVSELEKLQKSQILTKDIGGMAADLTNEILELENEKNEFLKKYDDKMALLKNNKLKYLQFIEREKGILS